MSFPIPPGTRDVLPDEMGELRALMDGVRGWIQRAGYGEVRTPTVEYEEVLRQGDERAAGAGWRLFDAQGNLLVLRSDMTIPIARLVGTRFPDEDGPLRLCYSGQAYRSVTRGSGQLTEFLQVGAELIGVPGVEGDAEVVSLVLEALSACGLRRHSVGLGDGALYRALLAAFDVPDEDADALMAALMQRDLVGLEARVRSAGMPEALFVVPGLRGGAEVLDRAEEAIGEVAATALLELRGLHEELARRGFGDRLILALGLVHELGYYTGAVFEVYDPEDRAGVVAELVDEAEVEDQTVAEPAAGKLLVQAAQLEQRRRRNLADRLLGSVEHLGAAAQPGHHEECLGHPSRPNARLEPDEVALHERGHQRVGVLIRDVEGSKQRSVERAVAQPDRVPAQAAGRQRLEHEAHDLGIALDSGNADQLRAHLQELGQLAAAARDRAISLAAVAEPQRAVLVREASSDEARDRDRHVRAQHQQVPLRVEQSPARTGGALVALAEHLLVLHRRRPHFAVAGLLQRRAQAVHQRAQLAHLVGQD